MPTPAKYFGTPSDPNGHPILWPGTLDGYPVRDPAGLSLLKQDEYENLTYEFDFRSRVFKIPQEMDDYTAIMDRIVNGLWLKSREEVHYSADGEHFVVWLTWIEPYGRRPPAGAEPGV